jgi:hypothetical protein
VTASTSTRSYAIVPTLVPGESYQYTINVADEAGNVSQQTITFVANRPPHFGKVTVDPVSGTENTTLFTALAENWVDPEGHLPFQYKWSYLISNQEVTIKELSNLYETDCYLPAGSISVKGYVCDSIGTCGSAVATAQVAKIQSDDYQTYLNTYSSNPKDTTKTSIPEHISTTSPATFDEARSNTTTDAEKRTSIFTNQVNSLK